MVSWVSLSFILAEEAGNYDLYGISFLPMLHNIVSVRALMFNYIFLSYIYEWVLLDFQQFERNLVDIILSISLMIALI